MKITQLTLSLIACFLAANHSYAADEKAKEAKESTKEVRGRMAEAHEKMATCLKTDKSFNACRDEMRDSMAGQHEEFGCGWGRGRGRGFSKTEETKKSK